MVLDRWQFCSFKYFLVGDFILPGDLKNFAEESEVECVKSSFLSRVGRPCLSLIQQGTEDAYRAFKSLSRDRSEVIVEPRYLKASTELSAWLLIRMVGSAWVPIASTSVFLIMLRLKSWQAVAKRSMIAFCPLSV